MEHQTLWQFLYPRLPELSERTAEHLMLTCVSTLIAAVLGLLLAACAYKMQKLREPIMSLVGILQTIPSLAMLVFLMTLFGCIGMAPALVALTLYALLPICRNCLLGLIGTAPAVVEAAQGLGMTELQELILVRVPIALPAIVAGLRTAVVVGVGIATLSAFIGAGGLGEFINRGLALSDSRLILLGAIPSGILAVIADQCLAAAEWAARPVATGSERKPRLAQLKRAQRALAASLPVVLFVGSIAYYLAEHPFVAPQDRVRIGSKHFTEQFILGELMAQALEARTRLSVVRRFGLEGTMVCHGALQRGEIDIYPEYTGTSLWSILKLGQSVNPERVLSIVSSEYEKRYRIKWLRPFGFNNTWALIVKNEDAKSRHWHNISDLASAAPSLRIGLTSEFAERQDGYPGLSRCYGLEFRTLRDIDTNIAYKALAERQIDVAAGNATDGHIKAFDLFVLGDDRSFFSPYTAAPIVRDQCLAAHPEVADVLNLLGNTISDEDMRRLNYEVDGNHRSPAEVAHQFLVQHKIVQ